MERKRKGEIGEEKVTLDLMERGYNVARPINEGIKYDLVFEKNGDFKKVQVKSVESDGEVIIVSLRGNNNPRGNDKYTYTSDMIDVLAVYDYTLDKCFYLKEQAIDQHKEMTLRITDTKNNQQKLVNYAEDYTEI